MTVPRNSAILLAGSIIPLGVSLVTVPIYIATIGLDRYGVLLLVWTMIGDFGFTSLGMGPAVQQGIAALVRGTDAQRSEVYWGGFLATLVASAVGAALIFGVAHVYFDKVDASASLSREIEQAIPIIALLLPISMISNLSHSAILGRERFLNATVVSTLGAVLQASLPLVAALLFSQHLIVLMAAAVVARTVPALLQTVQSIWIVPAGRPRLPSRGVFQGVLRFGGWMTLRSIVAPMLKNIERYFIGASMGAGAVSLYGVPANLVSRVALFPDALSRVLFPRFAAHDDSGRSDLESRSIQALNALMGPLILAAAVVIGPFMVLWLGHDLALRTTPIALILLVGWWGNSFARVSNARLDGSGRPDLIPKIMLIEAPIYGMLVYFTVALESLTIIALLWSLRALFDSGWVLALTGKLGLVLRQSWPFGLLILISVAIGSTTDPFTPWSIGVQAVLFGLGAVLAWRIAPPQLRDLVLRFLRKRSIA